MPESSRAAKERRNITPARYNPFFCRSTTATLSREELIPYITREIGNSWSTRASHYLD
jgi:hypothetical protein